MEGGEVEDNNNFKNICLVKRFINNSCYWEIKIHGVVIVESHHGCVAFAGAH